MNSRVLLAAFSHVDDRFLEEAETYRAPAAPKRLGKLGPTVLLAALLALLLAACGWMVYRATMSYRELHTDDQMRYYLNITNGPDSGKHLELNFGESAMALHFETEAEGPAYCFRPTEELTERYTRNEIASFYDFLLAFEWEGNPRPIAIEQSLQEAGMTAEEAKGWYKSLGYFEGDSLKLRIELRDGPQLYQADQIFGWPQGEATVIREDDWGAYQRLEFLVDVELSEGRHRVSQYLLLFQPEKQVLVTFSAENGVFSFAELEEMAGKLELWESGFTYSCDKSAMNFSVADFAAG